VVAVDGGADAVDHFVDEGGDCVEFGGQVGVGAVLLGEAEAEHHVHGVDGG